MAKTPAASKNRRSMATPEDIRRVFGDLDNDKVLDIIALRPTIQDLEHASLWLAGDSDVYGAGTPLPASAGDIVAIVTANEENDRAP